MGCGSHLPSLLRRLHSHSHPLGPGQFGFPSLGALQMEDMPLFGWAVYPRSPFWGGPAVDISLECFESAFHWSNIVFKTSTATLLLNLISFRGINYMASVFGAVIFMQGAASVCAIFQHVCTVYLIFIIDASTSSSICLLTPAMYGKTFCLKANVRNFATA